MLIDILLSLILLQGVPNETKVTILRKVSYLCYLAYCTDDIVLV